MIPISLKKEKMKIFNCLEFLLKKVFLGKKSFSLLFYFSLMEFVTMAAFFLLKKTSEINCLLFSIKSLLLILSPNIFSL